MTIHRPMLGACLCAALVCVAHGSGCAHPPLAVEELQPDEHGFAFEQYEIATGSSRHQTLLTGFLLGGARADLVVVDVDEHGDRDLRILASDASGWTPYLDVPLRPEVLFVDVARISGRDRLLTYERGRLNWFDCASSTEHELVATRSEFAPRVRAPVPHVDVTRDVNGDARDDLLLPDVDGFWVYVQRESGAFAAPVKLAPSASAAMAYETHGYRYDPWDLGRVHELDYDLDGRRDLAFWSGDRFELHRQDERGLFYAAAETFTVDVPFDSDDHAALAAPRGVRQRRKDHMPTGGMSGSVLHSLADVNGDGIADLVVFELEVTSMWNASSSVEVHFGSRRAGGGTRFAPEVGTAVRSNGVPVGFWSHDLDRDGRTELLFMTIGIGPLRTIGMILGALLKGTVALKLELHRLDGATFPAQPAATRAARAVEHGASGERSAVFPAALVGDVNGDGLADLLVQRGRKSLGVFLGLPGPQSFARRSRDVAVSMPNEEFIWLVDLDGDGKQDLLMHHPSSSGQQRVTILMSR